MNEIRKTAAIAGTNDAADKALSAVIGERQVFVHYKRHKAIHLHTCPECLHAAAVIESNR